MAHVPSSARDWRTRAGCLDEDPELFFADGEHGRSTNQLELARRICRVCPVQQQCLDAALANGTRYGMWGGTTPDERRTMVRRGMGSLEELLRSESPYVNEIPPGPGGSWGDGFRTLREWADSRREPAEH